MTHPYPKGQSLKVSVPDSTSALSSRLCRRLRCEFHLRKYRLQTSPTAQWRWALRMRRSVGAGGGVVLALWPRPSTRCWIRKDRRQLRSERHSTGCEPAPPESDRPSKAGRRAALGRGRSAQCGRHSDLRRVHTHQLPFRGAAALIMGCGSGPRGRCPPSGVKSARQCGSAGDWTRERAG